MSRYDNPLDSVRIASPCSADWNAMVGDERKRFCGECNLNVYNLSGMTRYDAEHLLRLSEGRLCVRYFQRPDGTVLTQDCPVGWAKVKQRVTFFAAAAFSVVMSIIGAVFLVSSFRKTPEPLMGAVALKPSPTPKNVVLMGDVAAPTPTPTPRMIMGNIALPTPIPTPKREKMERVIASKPRATDS